MIPDADYVYEGLLRYNYFPMVKEHRDDIPPLFSTEALTTDIADKLIAQQDTRKRHGFDQIEYRATRFDNLLRLMHIPHPYPFSRLCKCIHDNWEHLKHVCENERSIIKPSIHDGRVVIIEEYERIEPGRVIVMDRDHFPDTLMRHLDLSCGAQYLVDADVSSCFPSLYTHAIPWALVGHEHAKAHRGPAEWFNELDTRQRYLKRNETHGVPVGPGTSHLINEVVLSRVDEELEKKGYCFFRAIDDYNCYARTRDQAEEFIRDLEKELAEYLLLLNAKKVSISDLPLPAKPGWVTDLTARLPSNGTLKAPQMAHCLDHAVTLQSDNPQGSVLKYATRMLSRQVNESNVKVYFRYLLQLAIHYPVVLPVVCQTLQKWLVPLEKDYLHSIVTRHLEFRRSDAVSWSLYLLELTESPIPEDLAQQVVASRDCISMATLLALDCHIELVAEFAKTLDGKHKYELDKYWLLIYELTRIGRFNPSDFAGYVNETGLNALMQKKVAFIEKPRLKKRTCVGFDEEASE